MRAPPTLRSLYWTCFVAALLLLPACGGGGSGDDGARTFHRVHLRGLGGDAPLAMGAFGSIRLDADGTYSLAGQTNLDGSLGAPFANGAANLQWTAENDGELRRLFGSLPIAHAHMSVDDELAVSMDIGAQGPVLPGIGVWTRLLSGGGDDLLQGTYHGMGLSVSAAQATSTESAFFASFDGQGLVDIGTSTRASRNQVATTVIGLANQPYSVEADGTLHVLDATFRGAVTSDGQLAFAGGSTDLGSNPPRVGLYAFIKQATSAGLGTFQGEYMLVRIGRSHAFDGHYLAMITWLRADGLGGLTHALLYVASATSGAITHIGQPHDTGSYTVSSDGTITMVAPSAELTPSTGAISPNGKYGILQYDLEDSTPMEDIGLLIRVRDGSEPPIDPVQ